MIASVMAVTTAFGLRSCKNQHCTSGLKLAVNPDLDTKNVYDVRMPSIQSVHGKCF